MLLEALGDGNVHIEEQLELEQSRTEQPSQNPSEQNLNNVLESMFSIDGFFRDSQIDSNEDDITYIKDKTRKYAKDKACCLGRVKKDPETGKITVTNPGLWMAFSQEKFEATITEL